MRGGYITNGNLKEKLALLERIPGDGLLELANSNGIDVPNKNKVEEIREEIAANTELKDISSVYKEFEDAGNVTIHLFEIPKFSLLDPSEPNDEKEIQALTKKLKPKNKQKEIEIAKVEKISGENKIKLKINTKGKEISEIDAQTNKLVKFDPLLQIVAIIHLNDGLVEIRTRERYLANLTVLALSKILGLPYNKISFEEDDLEEMVNWASKFRNATMKPLSGGISSIRMTASKDSDLNSENLYKNRDTIIGETLRTGIYLQFDINRSKNDIRTIGFQINAKQGKIFFRTIAREIEIDTILKQIKEVKNVGQKT